MSIKYTVMILCALGHIGGIKAELHVYFEEVTVEKIDPKYFDPMYTDVFVTEENTISSNWTIIKKFPLETTGTLKMLGLSMGKYIQPTGVHYAMPFCGFVSEPIIMGTYLTTMGFTPDVCPPEPGTYYQESWTVQMETLPDDFIENKYLLTFEISLKGKILFLDKVYLETQNF